MTFPIVALADGEVADPQWFEDITDAVNDHETRVDTLESQVATSSESNTDPTTSRTTSSTTFTSTLSPANICGTSFVAPTSGKVLVTWRCTLVNSGANYTACSYSIASGSTVGSGTTFQAADDSRTVSTDSTTFEGQGASEYVSGLTPGATYNVFLMHRTSNGASTATFLRRTVGVVPLIA